MNNMDSYQAKKITQCFSGVAVLHDVDFNVKAGNIHGLFGHNGAGKSTLLKILAGVNQPTKGQLLLSNQPIHIHSPKEALDHGITCVYQELRLLPQLTVWQNLFLGRELKKGIFIDTISMLDHCEKLLAEYQLTISPHALVKDLSHPDKQMLEVITNLDRKAKFLFLDEPTTALEGNQADKLLSTVQKIAKKENIGVVLVSHKLDEVLGVCDEATVMCGGKIIFHAEGKAIQKQVIIDAIIGGDKRSDNVAASLNQKQHANTNQKPMLTIANLVTPRLASINLKAYAGEILGIYGLAGSGRTRFAKTLYGLETIKKGEITLLGQNYHPKNPADAIQHGVAYLTEERKKDGFIPLMSSINNSVLSILEMFKKKGFIDHNYMQNQANEVLTKLDTKGNIHGPMTSLSGGNQQKVLFSRVINQNANLIILDEPTKGVDIGAKSDIYDIIHQLAQQQCCIIVISSEEDELIQICHRIMIFKQGMCDGKAMLTHGLTPSQLREAAWHHH